MRWLTFRNGDGLLSSTTTKDAAAVEAHENEGETTWVWWWVVDSSSAVVAIIAIWAELNELRVGDESRGVDWTSLGMRRVTASTSRFSSDLSRRSYEIMWGLVISSCAIIRLNELHSLFTISSSSPIEAMIEHLHLSIFKIADCCFCLTRIRFCFKLDPVTINISSWLHINQRNLHHK